MFSIIVVCLNPGEKLRATLDSIQKQTIDDYEVIVKDGGSTDDSLSIPSIYAQTGMDIQCVSMKDTGIYDAMNEAVKLCMGRYVFFLNCGDVFSDSDCLSKVKEVLASDDYPTNSVYYGDIYETRSQSYVKSNPKIDEFACYRNIPCHQACFYSAELLKEHPFKTEYKVRADYEHFLWCYFEKRALMKHMGFCVADYEGNGYSESKEGAVLSKAEHKTITSAYIPQKKLRKYKTYMVLTLQPLRKKLAQSSVTAGMYNKLKSGIYRNKKEND